MYQEGQRSLDSSSFESASQAAFRVGPGWAPVGQSWAPNGPRMGLTGAHLGMLLGMPIIKPPQNVEAYVQVLFPFRCRYGRYTKLPRSHTCSNSSPGGRSPAAGPDRRTIVKSLYDYTHTMLQFQHR